MNFLKEKVLIGTSGWSYEEWRGRFYPKVLKKEDYLLYYSQIFHATEINSTFYNIPSVKVVENWVKNTPDNFMFSAKLPQGITHDNKLDVDECMDDLDYYLKAIEPLMKSKKLLSLLIQLPPSFKKGEHFTNLKEFIDQWPHERDHHDYELVVEFRHESWMRDDVFKYLKDNSLTYCAVIEPILPPRMDVTNSNLAYIRFHGYGKKIWFDYFFDDEEIKNWAREIKGVIDKVERTSIYFNNHFSGYSPRNSLMMMKELSIKPRNFPRDVSVLEIKKKSGTYSEGQTSLDKFMR